MFTSAKFIVAAVMNLAAVSFIYATPAQTLNLPDPAALNAVDDDDNAPDVTARVARISFIRGDVQIRRVDGQDWETAVLNLPLVEGDEVSTGPDARLELQFSNSTHLRLDENAYLKMVTLSDDGIAVSLSQGTLSTRITSFDKDRTYFEIDAPQTTLAVQKAGSYRIDAGHPGDADLHVSIRDGGEARIYSNNAGFTLKSGRSARLYIEGDNAGEWETAEAVRIADDFDSWTSDRDQTIAKRLKDAFYDRYYDADIYGADDLNDNGNWMYTSSYGYVWRPYASAINTYADWSPYRYGHWRWVPPYGWVWINDEPWGWATYHYGRWIFDNGYWVWSPYGYYRNTRSWWFPALVVINIFNDNICWYPLGYHHHYNFNAHFHQHNVPPIRTGGIKPIPTPRPDTEAIGGKVLPRRQPPGVPPVANVKPGRTLDGGPQKDVIPPTGVVAIGKNDFGTNPRGIRKAPPVDASIFLAKDPATSRMPDLPDRSKLSGRISREIVTTAPNINPAVLQTKVGAAPRKGGAPLDQELKNTRIYGGGRPPATAQEHGGV